MKNIKDAVWGFIVGDALGVPYEFSTRNMMKDNPAVDMIGFGTYNQPPGTWSDDSSMMLCVLENIINNGSSKDLAKLFVKWYKEDYMTPHGKLFDIGITTSTSIQKLLIGVKPHLAGGNDEYASGNGSLMRCLPYAFVEDISKSIFKMAAESKITHRNTICLYCSIFYIKVMRSILEGNNKETAFQHAVAFLQYGWRIADSDNAQNQEKLSRLLNPSFYHLPESDIHSNGYVLSTIEATVWCFLNTENYKEAVLKAVNLGGDTDTISALTGGLAGLYYGKESIPEDWVKKIASPDIINNLIADIDLNFIN